MVAIFEWFLAHFWLHFWIIFDVWQKNDHKMKPKMKPKKSPRTPWNANILKMKEKCILHHLQQCWQVLAYSNSSSKDLVKLFSQVCQSPDLPSPHIVGTPRFNCKQPDLGLFITRVVNSALSSLVRWSVWVGRTWAWVPEFLKWIPSAN